MCFFKELPNCKVDLAIFAESTWIRHLLHLELQNCEKASKLEIPPGNENTNTEFFYISLISSLFLCINFSSLIQDYEDCNSLMQLVLSENVSQSLTNIFYNTET